MTGSPLFSKLEADRILRRAAELEGSEGRRLTAEELRSIASEAGFGTRSLDRAIAEVREEALARVRRPPVQRWGWIVTRISALREIPLDVGSDELMRAVRLLQPYRDGAARVRLEEGSITWRDRKGLRFTVTPVGGHTEIRVYVSKLLVRRGRWTEWVKSAADRLEALLWLVAERPAGGAGEEEPEGGAAEAERDGVGAEERLGRAAGVTAPGA